MNFINGLTKNEVWTFATCLVILLILVVYTILNKVQTENIKLRIEMMIRECADKDGYIPTNLPSHSGCYICKYQSNGYDITDVLYYSKDDNKWKRPESDGFPKHDINVIAYKEIKK